MSEVPPQAGSADEPNPFRFQSPGQILREIRQGLPETLDQATELIAPGLREETKPLMEQIEELQEAREYAVWMDSLFWMGAAAEELGRDAD